MRIPTPVARWLTLVSVLVVMGVAFGAGPSARALDTPDSGVLVFDLEAEASTIDEHTARIVWNLNANNIVSESVTALWYSSYLEKAGTLGGRVVIDLDTGTVSGEIIELWTCDDTCDRAYREIMMIATIANAQVEREGEGWRIFGKDTVSISYSAQVGWDEAPSDCGGTVCYTCRDRFCTVDDDGSGLASLDGRLDGTTLLLSFADGLQEDFSKMDFSELTRTVFFMSRFSMTVTGEGPVSATTTEPAVDATVPDETGSAAAIPDPTADAASPGDSDGGDGDESTTPATTGSANEPEGDDAGGLGSLFLAIALVFGVGVATMLFRKLLRRPSIGAPITSTADESRPSVEKPVVPAVPTKISDDEMKRIVDWGVKNNRTPEDIQKDVDAENETRGGSGTVPIDNLPVRVTLPQGEVTLSAEEVDAYKSSVDEIKAYDPEIRRIRRELAWSRQQVEKAIHLQDQIAMRWMAGMYELWRQRNRMRMPAEYLRKLGGYSSVEDMLVEKYHKPTYTDSHDRYQQAVKQWEQGPDGRRFEEHCANIKSAAIRAMQEMTSSDPSGRTGPFNQALKTLNAHDKYREGLTETLREVNAKKTALREMERQFSLRIKKAPVA